MNYTDRIFPTNKGLTTYLDELLNKNYQVPTFQRDVVWEKSNVKKLWDSIYKFYPLGSVLIWKTDIKLQSHRAVGGHELDGASGSRSEYQYILDGQQRTTSLLTSLYGGTIHNRQGFDPTLYVDLTVKSETETDDESYKKRFLFWDEIDDKGGVLKKNSGKRRRFEQGLVVKLIDIKQRFGDVERSLVEGGDSEYQAYDHPVRVELRRLKEILDNYRISFIEVKGIQVSEVCQIFERINQSGKPLNIFDIVVAKTFRPANGTGTGFYLRELIDGFKNTNQSEFFKIDDLNFLQIMAIAINRNVEGTNVRNITDRYLNEIKTEEIEQVWGDVQKAILKTFDFFENHLNLYTPYLIPYRYYYMTIANYFWRNSSPDYDFLKKYFWFYSFHNEDLLSNTTQLFLHLDLLDTQKRYGKCLLGRFLIDKNKLRTSSYSSKGRLSRAVLALLANQKPKDWEHCDRNVLARNLFFATDSPNLHHIFPTNSEYVLNNRHANLIDSNSLMNIAYLTQITNLSITNKDPLNYLRGYDTPEFETILPAHFIPMEVLQWVRYGTLPEFALDLFIEKRLDLVLRNLEEKLSGVQMEVIDTAASDG